jgi:AAA+ ATPase superfamily predicted ATPase
VDFPFLDRRQELARLTNALSSPAGAFVCVYGRRRLGKSRLIQRALRGHRYAYYVGDDRDSALQRTALAREIGRILPGFESVRYPDWEPLLERWWKDAPANAVLAIDELPAIVATSPELPSLLQKFIDQRSQRRHVVLCGSSQRMMQGLVLDATAPLYGRAREILKLEPLAPYWLGRALKSNNAADIVERYCTWGGVPRYWELARDYASHWKAIQALVLDPLGVLHEEPARLLLDDVRDAARSASVLALIGQGCHRLSEIAGRLGLPATQLSRPLARLVDLGLVIRELPYGTSLRDTKRTLYRIADALLEFSYTFVEPNRSRLAAGQIAQVRAEVERQWPQLLGQRWEALVRSHLAGIRVLGGRWNAASRFWGRDARGAPLELDIVADAADGSGRVLVGEAKVTCRSTEVAGRLAELERKAAACPALVGKQIEPTLWILRIAGLGRVHRIFSAKELLSSRR